MSNRNKTFSINERQWGGRAGGRAGGREGEADQEEGGLPCQIKLFLLHTRPTSLQLCTEATKLGPSSRPSSKHPEAPPVGSPGSVFVLETKGW